jgi:SAM-dependent methyltransferase
VEVPGDWWATFFDGVYVEAWTAAGAFDRTDELVDELVAMLDLPEGARILDVPCGFGRIAGPLHERGYEVVGIDISAEQIDLARDRNPGPTYLVGDMRRPPEGPFDAVLNIFTSFGYFAEREEDLSALQAWYGSVRAGGQLVMVLNDRDRFVWHEARRSTQGGGDGPDTDDDRDDAGTIVREVRETDWVEGVQYATVTYQGATKSFRVRLYTATELVRELREVGFTEVEAFAGLDRSPLAPETPLVIRAVR